MNSLKSKLCATICIANQRELGAMSGTILPYLLVSGTRAEPILGSATRFGRVSDTRYSKLTYIEAQGPIYL